MAVAVSLSPLAVMQFFDNTGKPAVGGSLLTQVGGVNYPTYSDSQGTVALPNPIPLNSRGECSTAAGSSTTVFLAQGVSYTFTLSDKSGNQLWSLGNIAVNSLSIPYIATSGTNTIIGTFSPAITSLVDGLTVEIKVANTTTAAATFNPNGLGAGNLYYADGVTQLVAGALIQNNIYEFIYDSSLNSSAGGFLCMNPSRVIGSFTGTLTGFTAGNTGTINYSILPDGRTAYVYISSAMTGTSNTTAMTMTGIPAVLTTTTSKFIICRVEDFTASAFGGFDTGTGTTWTFHNGATINTNTFTNTGTKGLPGSPSQEISFTLD